jgi:non-specific serine/threonine protein kinase
VALWPLWRAGGYLGEARVAVVDALRAAADEISPLRARALEAASDLAGSQGDYEEAKRTADESMAAYERLGDREGVARALVARGWWALQEGDTQGSRSFLERALAVAPESASARERLGVLALHERDPGRARQLFEETLAAYRRENDMPGIRTALIDLGLVSLAEDRLDEAESFFNESLSLFLADGDTWGVSYCVEDIAAVIAARDPERAAELLGWAELVRERLHHPLDAFEQGIHDRTLAAVRRELDKEAFVAAWHRGRELTPYEAAKLASGARAAETA